MSTASNGASAAAAAAAAAAAQPMETTNAQVAPPPAVATPATATVSATAAATSMAPSNTAGVVATPAPSSSSSASAASTPAAASEKKEIYTYEAPWLIYGMNWSVRPDQRFRVALGSFVEDYNNKVEVVQLNEETGKFQSKGTFIHPYPTTKIMWCPDKTGAREDLLATTGDYLRIWKMPGEGSSEPIKMQQLLNNNKNSEFCIAAGTLIPLADGSSVAIEKVAVGALVFSRNLTGVIPLPVSHILSQGVKECVELVFSDKRVLVCTPDHRILQSNGRWLRADEMSINDSWVAASMDYPHSKELCSPVPTDLPLSKVQLMSRRDVGEREVWDLSVPNKHGEEYRSFMANGIMVHNCAPLTSFDWNETDPSMVGTSSIDTTW